MHTCDDISISEILYHYHDMENYITIIDISIILHITSNKVWPLFKGRYQDMAFNQVNTQYHWHMRYTCETFVALQSSVQP